MNRLYVHDLLLAVNIAMVCGEFVAPTRNISEKRRQWHVNCTASSTEQQHQQKVLLLLLILTSKPRSQ